MAGPVIKSVGGTDKSAVVREYAASQTNNGGSRKEAEERFIKMNAAPDGMEEEKQSINGQKEDIFDECRYFSRQTSLRMLLNIVRENNREMKKTALKTAKRPKVDTRAALSALGLSVDAAIAKFEAVGIKIGEITEEYDCNVPKGHVIRQSPGPGTPVGRMGVRFVISKGPPV